MKPCKFFILCHVHQMKLAGTFMSQDVLMTCLPFGKSRPVWDGALSGSSTMKLWSDFEIFRMYLHTYSLTCLLCGDR